MRSLPKPHYVPLEVFDICAVRIADDGRRATLGTVRPYIVNTSVAYDQNGTNKSLYQLPRHTQIENIPCRDEMVWLYEQKMVPDGAPGREIYWKIRSSAPYGKCPFCSHRDVRTVDHYLPKTEYPAYAVLPYNLVPSCSDCNKGKSNAFALTAETQILHPYYDDVEGARQEQCQSVR